MTRKIFMILVGFNEIYLAIDQIVKRKLWYSGYLTRGNLSSLFLKSLIYILEGIPLCTTLTAHITY